MSASFAGSSAPPFEPDAGAASYGSLAFYDAAGNQVTSGTGDLSSPFAYVVASTAADTNAKTATVFFANPQHGVATGLWVTTDEAATQFNPASVLPAGTPADVEAFAPADPVAASSAADVTSWLAANASGIDTTAGYANTIQVRIQDSGGGGAGNLGSSTYWRTDVGYNTTSSAITVDGTTLPANGWAVLYPVITDNYTVLTTSASGGTLTAGNPITLTATVTPNSVNTGSVQFFDNGTLLTGGTATGTSGTFTYTYTPSGIGAQNYTATFLPTSGPGSTSTTTVQVSVPLIATTTTLAATSSTINFGASDTLTATVSAADNSTTGVTGSVEFLTGSTSITGCTAQATALSGAGTMASPGVGTATCTTTSLPSGSDSITAVFTPTSNSYATSTSSPAIVTVGIGTTTALSASSSTLSDGASDIFTATVSAADNSASGVTGSVEFLDGSIPIASCTAQATTVSGAGTMASPGVGTAGCTTGYLPSGSESITAVFNPTGSTYATSTSSAVMVTVQQTGVATALLSSSSGIDYGDSETFTATVSAADNSTTGVTGSVEFLNGTEAIADCTAQATTVNGAGTVASPGVGTATCATSALPKGSNSVTAVFTPTSNSYATLTSPAVGVTVRQASTTTVVSFSSDWITYGDEGGEILSVSVSPEFAGSAPAGTVTVTDLTSTLCAITLSGATGSCPLSASQLDVGSYYGLTASYAGSTDFAGSSDATAESLTVVPASSATTLSISAAKVPYGHEGTEKLSVSLRPQFSGSTPTGIVTVSESSRRLCAISLSARAGSCTLSARSLPPGSYGLVATYTGSLEFNSSASAKQRLTVSKETSKVALKLSSAKVTLGQETSEHISVNVSPEFAGPAPTGKVTVKSSSNTICVISLSSSGKGSCTLSANKLSAGTYGLVASYGGSSDFDTSGSTKETLKVVK
ncbi:MAG: Ig-like domain repeat protein [Acidimicrobiales bacterium]